MGEARGECQVQIRNDSLISALQVSKCSAYLAPEDSASYVNDPKATLCRPGFHRLRNV